MGFPTGEITTPRDASNYEFFKLLNSGATFGEAWLFTDSASGTLLGDPTLRLRPQKIASVNLEPQSLTLNSLQKLEKVKINNLGSEDLENLAGRITYNHAYDDKQLELEAQVPSELKPNSQQELLIAIEEAPKGSFNGQLHLVYAGKEGYWIQLFPISGTI